MVEVKVSAAPYDASIAAIMQLLATVEGQRILSRLLGETGPTQAQLQAAVKRAQKPSEPTLPRPRKGGV